jgi:hypothetical protein
VPSISTVVARGLVNGFKRALSWAPTVLVSLPSNCHMPSRRCRNSTCRRCCWVLIIHRLVRLRRREDLVGQSLQLFRPELFGVGD